MTYDDSSIGFASRWALAALIALALAGGCSSTSDPTGAAGHAGAGGVGGSSGAGGFVCPPPPSSSVFRCAPTYDQQVATGSCTGSGGDAVLKGPCGTGWGWYCRSIYTNSCVYDQDKTLVKARWCDDVPNATCQRCYPSRADCFCIESSDISTSGAACDINDLNRPPTGCASTGDGGVDCCGDGKLPPSGPPFNCAPAHAAQLATHCTHSGDCGGLRVVAEVGLAFNVTCGYDAQGMLKVARRCDTDSARYCGSQCLTSARVGDADGGTETLCGYNSLPRQCAVAAAARD